MVCEPVCTLQSRLGDVETERIGGVRAAPRSDVRRPAPQRGAAAAGNRSGTAPRTEPSARGGGTARPAVPPSIPGRGAAGHSPAMAAPHRTAAPRPDFPALPAHRSEPRPFRPRYLRLPPRESAPNRQEFPSHPHPGSHTHIQPLSKSGNRVEVPEELHICLKYCPMK